MIYNGKLISIKARDILVAVKRHLPEASDGIPSRSGREAIGIAVGVGSIYNVVENLRIGILGLELLD